MIDPVGLSGLIIALVALVIALFQLMQALFATADGYRNCKPPITSSWGESGRTRRRLVLSELRFETIYTVPLISIDRVSFGKQESHSIDGSDISRKETHCKTIDNAPVEMVTWISFLDQLHRLGSGYRAANFSQKDFSSSEKQPDPSSSYGAFLTCMERSWDFTSADINKPLAVSNVGTIAILVRRLGMTWTKFQPADSLLRAEGNQMTVTSTNVRSVGTILEFNRVERQTKWMARGELYIPGPEAEKLGFGIIHTWYTNHFYYTENSTFGNVPERFIRVGTADDCVQTMTMLCGEGGWTDKVRKNLERGQWMPGFSDIIPFAAPFMYKRGTGINRIPRPAHYSIGLTIYSQAFLVFRARLGKFIASHQNEELVQASRIRDCYDELHVTGSWDEDTKAKAKNEEENTAILDLIYDRGKEAEAWLSACTRNGSPVDYEDLMGCHIKRAVYYKDNADENIQSKTWRPIPAGAKIAGDGAWICEGMHKYCDWIMDYKNTDHFYEMMKRRDYEGSPFFLAEVWFTMMFRAFCWQRVHFMVKGHRVGSSYWNSRLPIYIT